MYVRTSMYVCMYVCMHVTYVCIAVYMYVYNQWRTKGVVWGFPPPPEIPKIPVDPRSHVQEEPAPRFPFVVHCVLVRL